MKSFGWRNSWCRDCSRCRFDIECEPGRDGWALYNWNIHIETLFGCSLLGVRMEGRIG